VTITFTENHHELVTVMPMSLTIKPNTSGNFNITVLAQSPGHVDVTGKVSPKDVVDDFNLFFRIIVANSRLLIIVSSVVGWVYFVAWSVSFYPQLVTNAKRKSVIGLSFDFMALNFMGHTLYAIFNTCLYFVPFFQEEYFSRFPRGLNPVELNDVFFSIHASFITALTIVQCFFYEVKRVNLFLSHLVMIKHSSSAANNESLTLHAASSDFSRQSSL
jgi:cystinosin